MLGKNHRILVSALLVLALLLASLLPSAVQSSSHETLMQTLVDHGPAGQPGFADEIERGHAHSHDAVGHGVADQSFDQPFDHSHDHNPGDHTHDLPLAFELQKVPTPWPGPDLKASALVFVIQAPLYRIKRPPRA
ncbi:hypothetical protein ACTL6U_10830 [Rhodovibrionaceae bacterium A322]